MNQFASLMHKLEMRGIVEEGKQREVAGLVFQEHRDRLISAYCAWMRLHYEVDRRNAAFPKLRPKKLDAPTREWCNAAVHILVAADEGVQRFFLSAEGSVKNEMVCAVIRDKGIENFDGFFVELPE